MPDGKNLLFVSNRNEQGIFDSTENSLCLMDLEKGTVKVLVSSAAGASSQIFLRMANGCFTFSRRNGVYDVYCLDLVRGTDERITALNGGAFSLRVGF
jgi:Tol biopolymer transport system component